MRSNTKYFLVFVVILIFSCVLPAYGIEQPVTKDSTTIKVAIPTPATKIGEDVNSMYLGYTEEYLHMISQYTGWQYEIIEVSGAYEDGLEQSLDMLRTGAADLVAPVQYRENIGNGVWFSQCSYTTAWTVLQVPNSVYTGTDLGNNLRVAILVGSGMQDIADNFFAKNDITAQYIVCQSVEEQIQLVCVGEADVMLNSNLEYIPNMSVIAEFSPQSLYFVGGDQALLEKLDQAIIYIRQANKFFSLDLYSKYASDDKQNLTLEETLFIEQAEPYVVAVMDHYAPYQYWDRETGECRGIAVDILNRIAQKTGLQFEYVPVASWDEMLQLIENGEVHIAAEMPHDYKFAAERGLTITSSYATSPYVLMAQKSFPGPGNDQRLALVQVNAYDDGYFLGNVVQYPTTDDCIKAVYSGEADYTYIDLYTAQYYFGDSGFGSFTFTPQSYESHSVCFGIAKPTPHELLTILNKSINQLSASDMQNIVSKNVNPPRNITLIDVIVAHPMQSLALIGSVSLLIACLLLFLLWRKEKISKTLRRKAMEDSLTQLYNAAACRKLITQKLLKMEPSQVGAFLIMDMDHFKEINDKYGHHAGDKVLQSFANMLRDILRGEEIIARIGGDEFVVYLDSIGQEENLRGICDRICEQARSIHIEERHITVSVGAVVARAKDDYDALYKLADKALYEAKYNQRNQFRLVKRCD